jgi:hypothetical protein
MATLLNERQELLPKDSLNDLELTLTTPTHLLFDMTASDLLSLLLSSKAGSLGRLTLMRRTLIDCCNTLSMPAVHLELAVLAKCSDFSKPCMVLSNLAASGT